MKVKKRNVPAGYWQPGHETECGETAAYQLYSEAPGEVGSGQAQRSLRLMQSQNPSPSALSRAA